MDRIENRTFDELRVGDSASISRTLAYKDIELPAVMTGNADWAEWLASHFAPERVSPPVMGATEEGYAPTDDAPAPRLPAVTPI